MRYYNDNAACIEAYVKQSSQSGGNPRGTIFFVQNIIYSYGPHFPMAVKIPDGFYIVNGNRYSTTTSVHQRALLRAIPDNKKIIISFTALMHIFDIHDIKDLTSELEKLKIIQDEFVYVKHKESDIVCNHIFLFEFKDRKFLLGVDLSSNKHNQKMFLLIELIDAGTNVGIKVFNNIIKEVM